MVIVRDKGNFVHDIVMNVNECGTNLITRPPLVKSNKNKN